MHNSVFSNNLTLEKGRAKIGPISLFSNRNFISTFVFKEYFLFYFLFMKSKSRENVLRDAQV